MISAKFSLWWVGLVPLRGKKRGQRKTQVKVAKNYQMKECNPREISK